MKKRLLLILLSLISALASAQTNILQAKDNFDPTVSDLTVEEISARLKASLSVTNTPSTRPQ
jgi:hypothetical protein